MNISAINDPTERFVAVMREREDIRLRHDQGLPKPWTDDAILREWSFCNIRREDDRTTRWISDHWRKPYQDDPDLWFAMVIARFVNWPDTLAELGYPVPWDPAHFLAVMNARKTRGEVCFGLQHFEWREHDAEGGTSGGEGVRPAVARAAHAQEAASPRR